MFAFSSLPSGVSYAEYISPMLICHGFMVLFLCDSVQNFMFDAFAGNLACLHGAFLVRVLLCASIFLFI